LRPVLRAAPLNPVGTYCLPGAFHEIANFECDD